MSNAPDQPGIRSPALIRAKGWVGWFGWMCVWMLLVSSGVRTSAQVSLSGRPCPASSAFVIRSVTTGREVARGWTSSRGTLGDGVVLGANQEFEMVVANGQAGTIGSARFRTGPNGSSVALPPVEMGTSIGRDRDNDGVPDDIELVHGTDPTNPNTLGVGIPDALVVATPPPPGSAGGVSAPPGTSVPPTGGPGLVDSVGLGGNAIDLSVGNDQVAVALGQNGVAILDVSGGLTPRLISMVDTPGHARAVSLGGDGLLGVADGPTGLIVVDLQDPANSVIRYAVPLGSIAQAVASAGQQFFVGLENGQLVQVDGTSGNERGRVNTGAVVHDVVAADGRVWVVSGNTLIVYPIPGLDALAGSGEDGVFLPELGRVPLSVLPPAFLAGRKRIHVGDGVALVTVDRGFDLLDVRNPAAMVRTGSAEGVGPNSFKHGLSTGNGDAFLAVGVSPRPDDPTHHVSFYDVGDPTVTTGFQSELRTPGVAHALQLHNGFLYVADGEAGLQTLRPFGTDRLGIAPVGSLRVGGVVPPPGGARVFEGSPIRLGVSARDDVAVRNVEFHLDGTRVAVDGSFPFETVVRAPESSLGRPTAVVRARIFDTGGNNSWSDPVTIHLDEDRRPLRVISARPGQGGIGSASVPIFVEFSGPLLPSTVSEDTVRLEHAGPDGVFGTADDVGAVPGLRVEYDALGSVVAVRTGPATPEGRARLILLPEISDRRGNRFRDPYSLYFALLNRPDRDGDGVPDDVEVALGLNPDAPYSGNSLVRDGERDIDNDGLGVAFEILYGFDPDNPRSVNPEIVDGDLDSDGDGLSNRREAMAGTHPLVSDTDGDGWNDETEVTVGTDPLNPDSRPAWVIPGGPVVSVVLPRVGLSTAGFGAVQAHPTVHVVLPSLRDILSTPIVSSPTVTLDIP